MSGLKVTYLGQCGFLLDFGHTRIVTDPYLSDYVDQNFFTAETPWRRLYPAPTGLASLKPDGVLISHSHGDHLDPWTLQTYVSGGGKALIAVPAPERGYVDGFAAGQVIQSRAEESFMIGPVKITPIACAHTQLHTDEAGRFYELSYLIECGDARVFFGGDMSLYDGLKTRIAAARPTLLLLPVNGADKARTDKGIIGNIDHVQAAALAASLHTAYIPMHHDLYAINGCSKEDILKAAHEMGAEAIILKPMEALEV